MLWPITESYVSGGRTGRELRRAVGRFNIVWSTAVVISFWAMAPLAQSRPLHVLTLLGFIHLAAIGLLIPMGREPGRHIPAQRQPHPPVYTRLLAVFRFQLPASYIVISALAPFLPFALIRLEVDIRHAMPIASAWTVSRLATFVLMERWHGWQGRWWLFFVTALLMLAGFALCLIASAIGGRQSLPLLIAGLAACGIGIGGVYTAAFYYVMEVGDATVSAGPFLTPARHLSLATVAPPSDLQADCRLIVAVRLGDDDRAPEAGQIGRWTGRTAVLRRPRR